MSSRFPSFAGLGSWSVFFVMATAAAGCGGEPSPSDRPDSGRVESTVRPNGPDASDGAVRGTGSIDPGSARRLVLTIAICGSRTCAGQGKFTFDRTTRELSSEYCPNSSDGGAPASVSRRVTLPVADAKAIDDAVRAMTLAPDFPLGYDGKMIVLEVDAARYADGIWCGSRDGFTARLAQGAPGLQELFLRLAGF